ncbi:helix-turn-helix transcriptional regulator [Amycolatopsis magusensis]|uniref:DNA-binding CsgD family transcriptional regulator n=1 Tax=Amycolatopsis magusensis TaxID=882444 RepID=A0ABS4PPH7_9PSEU|nr:LuxR family transcriptional regulator [Amycolatopsis magusensis]MBP2181327.1 DNA-binding CsgD family transcriptional regulator [Amycolatopsis magusensis]
MADRGAELPAGLVEREAQWDRLTGLLGTGGHVVRLTGPVATGKTELLGALADAVDRPHCAASCSRAERALPFGVVHQLFRGLSLPPETAERLDRVLEIGAGEVDERQLARVRHSLCRILLDQAPILVTVDDVQHADAESVEWLCYLLRRLDDADVLLVLTEVDTPRPGHSPLHDELARHGCVHLELPPLSEEGVAALAAEQLGGRRARRLAPKLYPVTGGSPLLVRAVLADLPEQPGEVVPGPCFREGLLSSLHRCEPDVLTVARSLAVLGDTASSAMIADLGGLGVAAVEAAIELLNAAELLEHGQFRHPEARAAVLADMSAEDRRARSLAAARLRHDQGASAVEVAPYLLDAEDVHSPWTVPVLVEAADHALRDERIEEAVRFLELAHRVCPGTQERAAIAARLARAEWRVNPSAAARRLPPLVQAVDRLAEPDVLALVRQLLWDGRFAEAKRALEVVEKQDRPVLRGGRGGEDARAMELWLACSHPALATRGQVPVDSARRSLDLTTGPSLKATAALAGVLAYGPGEQVVTDAEQVLEAARPSDSLSWGPETAMSALLALVYADRLEVAQTACERLLAESRTPVSRALFAAARAEIAVRRGELPVAVDQAQTALDLLPPTGWGVGAGLPLGSLITALTRMGRHTDAAKQLEQSVPEAMFQSRHGLHYLAARGTHYLATTRHYAALADFLACGELMTSWGLDMPGLVPWRTSAAEAWLRHGNRDEARRLINEQLAKLGPGGSRTRGTALRLLAATSQPHTRPQLLAEAVSILEEHGDQYELALALADLSRTHQALREHRRAWTIARRAWHVANACDAAELCEELLPSRSSKPEVAKRKTPAAKGIDALTDAERRVAALAAVGYTNREIANKLFITPSTIEQHLTRVYRKLNVKYRKDLPADLLTDLAGTA